MEKLPKSEQAKVKKASSERLRALLIAEHYAKEEVEKLDRDNLMRVWAEVLAAKLASGGAGDWEEEKAEKPAAVDPALEKTRLEFEKYRFDVQMKLEAEKIRQQEEDRKLEVERIRQQEEERKWKKEYEEQMLLLEQKKLELEERKQAEDFKFQKEMHTDELQQEAKKAAEERERLDSHAAKVKRYGDALRNSITRQSNDALEAITFFRTAEALFQKLEVPAGLQGILIRPFLNDRSKTLVARLDDKQAASYDEIKAMILREYKLSPATYREKFNTLRKQDGETYVMFTSRLRALLDSYLESRKVGTFDQVCELLLADRVKNTLGENVLKHVLATECTKDSGWLQARELAEVIDTYLANYLGDKPRAGALGIVNRGSNFQQRDNRTQQSTKFGPPSVSSSQPSQSTDGANSQNGQTDKEKRCFICSSNKHLRNQCPLRSKTGTNSETRTNDTRRVNACVTSNNARDSRETGPRDVVSSVRPVETPPSNSTPVKDKPADSVRNKDSVAAGGQAAAAAANNTASVHEVIVDTPSVVHVENFDLVKLHYIQVGIAGDSDGPFKQVDALEDSGAEIAVARTSLIAQLVNVNNIGSVRIRGVVGESVPCNLVRICVCLYDNNGNAQCKRSLMVPCATSDDANDDLLLPISVVERLRSLDVECNDDIIDNDTDYDDNNDDDDDDDVSDVDAADGDCDVNVVTRSGRDTSSCTNTAGSSSTTANSDQSLQAATDNNGISVDYMPADSPSEVLYDEQQSLSTRNALIKEQQDDETLKKYWHLADQSKGGFRVDDNGLLMHQDRILGHDINQLVLPIGRRKSVLEIGHGTVGAHMAWRNTERRIKYNFWWPTMRKDCMEHCKCCEVCQQKARITCWDRVPIKPIPRPEVPFEHWFFDVGGPLSSENFQYNYFVVFCDSMSRYPVAYALRTVTSKSIVDCILNLCQTFGCPSYLSCDNASYNTSDLTRELTKRIGVSIRFITPGHKEGDALAERGVQNIKTLIAKVAVEHPKSWHKLLGFVLWALREIPNETTHVPPALLVFGRIPRGPLAVLKETWCGEREFPPGLGKGPVQYLKELHENLRIAQDYAEAHTQREQQRYVQRYNRRSRDKRFKVNDEVLILKPDSTKSRVFSRWKGPAKIVAVKSPYSYIVELDGARYHLHANDLRPYHVKTEEVAFDSDVFGTLNESKASVVQFMSRENDDICAEWFDTLQLSSPLGVATCAIIHEEDEDFGAVQTLVAQPVPPSDERNLMPSQRIEPEAVAHLSELQRQRLFAVLDRFPDVFRDEPGLCKLVQHEVPTTADFRPRRLRAYRIPERLKPEVDRQIQGLLAQGFIRRSTSPMASPLVCVLKGPGGRDGVRLAVDYRFVNKYTIPDAFPVPDIQEVVQRIGNARFISTFDANQGFWQTAIKPEDQWKSGFVCGDQLYEWTRTPFGMRSSGCTFCRAVQLVLQPIKTFADSYVDDMAVYSMMFDHHLEHLTRFLLTIRDSGFTLKLKKCKFAQPEVKFCGQLVGSGTRRADPDKVSAVKDLKAPESKRQVRQILGFFSYFRENIPDFAAIAKPLTDLTAKSIPSRVPWGPNEQTAFEKLKQELCRATEERLYIIDLDKPFHLLVDASDHTVSGVLTQQDEHGRELPIAFSSQKLNKTQQNWATVEKEAFAALSALRKYRNWIFGTKVIVFSDHNPLTFLTESVPKSAKLMRWALALQEYDVEFRYRAGVTHIVPDVLTRFL